MKNVVVVVVGYCCVGELDVWIAAEMSYCVPVVAVVVVADYGDGIDVVTVVMDVVVTAVMDELAAVEIAAQDEPFFADLHAVAVESFADVAVAVVVV